MTFWILLGLLCLLSVAAVAWPLLRGQATAGLDNAQSQLAVMRDRNRELDREQASGRLTAAEADDARAELVDSLADALPPSETAVSDPASGNKSKRILTAAMVTIAMPVLAFMTYQYVGEPQIGAYPEMVSRDAPYTAEEIKQMLAQLSQHTQDNPNDGEAWLALAQARRVQGEYAESAKAYGRAAALLPPSARLLADQAEMTAVAQGRVFAGVPEQLLLQALKIDPAELKVNALLGATYMQAQQQAKALPHLRILLDSLDPNDEESQQIAQVVAGIEERLSQAPPMTNAAPKALAGPTIRGRIELAGEAIPAEAVLFISARAPTGPRIPYAAVRIAQPQLPMNFELSDANAMNPQRPLSSADQVVLEARLSLSGNAIRQSGDRLGTSISVKTDSQDVMIRIDQTVP